DPPSLVAETKSDPQGQFSLSNVDVLADSKSLESMPELYVTATAEGRVSVFQPIFKLKNEIEISKVLESSPEALSGIVTDEAGRPVVGASGFLRSIFQYPLPGLWNAITDKHGRYTITGLKPWKPTRFESFDKETGLGLASVDDAWSVFVNHPDYALTQFESRE